MRHTQSYVTNTRQPDPRHTSPSNLFSDRSFSSPHPHTIHNLRLNTSPLIFPQPCNTDTQQSCSSSSSPPSSSPLPRRPPLTRPQLAVIPGSMAPAVALSGLSS
ncbi:hypothetical protein EJ05DRAFT_4513 [Pseudovirgaria hyperparasitica]|uniref:Uncharacterized protein n=1 Tax=Pseudovirgaria hyperparasitica TaxID=470096 RepID=A0A6A6WK64_9PEZI|nr:uncharacterized protein EJ05DRAFT_4513 [Pseudovirgaria hyperparasitica]KAF2762521.1 hypothetical protein EJ05DRAFT_4513 [Pseudovirgaria hyperparasitica]